MERGIAGQTTTLIMIILTTIFFLRSIWRWINYKEQPIAKEIILVTGAAQGIGKELALQYGLQGGRIICVDLNQTKNEETVQELKTQNIEAHAYTCNVANFEDISALQQKIEKDIGPISIIIANAGIAQLPNLIENINERDFKDVIDVNFCSLFWILKVFLPGMKKRNHGHIVAVSSITGLAPLPGLSVYSASKKAVGFLMRATREEVEITGENVKFTTVFPDFTETGISGELKKFMPLMLTTKTVAEATINAHKRGATEVSIPWHYLPLCKLLDSVSSVSGLKINYWVGKLEGIGNQRAWGNFWKNNRPVST